MNLKLSELQVRGLVLRPCDLRPVECCTGIEYIHGPHPRSTMTNLSAEQCKVKPGMHPQSVVSLRVRFRERVGAVDMHIHIHTD
jgi:hypothetical protein